MGGSVCEGEEGRVARSMCVCAASLLINGQRQTVVEPLVEFLSTSLYSAFGSSVVAVGRSGVFTPNIGTNG